MRRLLCLALATTACSRVQPPVDSGAVSPSTPRVTAAGEDVYLLWSDEREGDQNCYFKIMKGGQWGATTRLFADQPGSGDVAAAPGPDGRLHVVWSQAQGEAVNIYYGILEGNTFSEVIDLSETPGISIRPDIAVSQYGDVYVTWLDDSYEGGAVVLFASRPKEALDWGETEVMSDLLVSGMDYVAPRVLCDQTGVVHLFWNQVDAEGTETLFHGFYSPSAEAWGRSEPPAALSGNYALSDRYVDIDGSGNLHLVWQTAGGVAYSRFDAKESEWLPGSLLFEGGGHHFNPTVIASGKAVCVLWNNRTFRDFDVPALYGRRYEPGSGWGEEKRLVPGVVMVTDGWAETENRLLVASLTGKSELHIALNRVEF